MFQKTLAVVLLGGGLVVLATLSPVAAQYGDQAAVATANTATDSALLIDKTNPRQGTLAKTYLDSVEAYRQAQKQYDLARDQYYQLNTLTAQAEAIRRARDLMAASAQTTAAYFTYLQAILERTNGINLNEKEPLIENLAAWQVALREFQNELPGLTARAAVDNQLQRFNGWKSSISNLAAQTLALIKIGEQQTAWDTAQLLTADMQIWVNVEPMTSTVQERKQRGLDEVSNLLQQTSAALNTTRSQYTAASKNNAGFTDLMQKTDSVYVLLRQISTFLREVAKL